MDERKLTTFDPSRRILVIVAGSSLFLILSALMLQQIRLNNLPQKQNSQDASLSLARMSWESLMRKGFEERRRNSGLAEAALLRASQRDGELKKTNSQKELALIALGDFYGKKGVSDKGASALSSALAIAKSAGSLENRDADLYFRLSAKQIPFFADDISRTLLSFANAEFDQSHFDSAILLYRHFALIENKRIDLNNIMFDVNLRTLICCRKLRRSGDADAALIEISKCLDNDPSLVAQALDAATKSYEKFGDLYSAEKILSMCGTVIDRTDVSVQKNYLRTAALFYRELPRNSEASELYKRLVALLEKEEPVDCDELQHALENFAYCVFLTDNKLAEASYMRLIVMEKAKADVPSEKMGNWLAGLGLIYYNRREMEKSKRFLNNALDVFRKSDHSDSVTAQRCVKTLSELDPLNVNETKNPMLLNESESNIPASSGGSVGSSNYAQSRTYGMTGGHHWIKENHDGQLIELEDGSLWRISDVDQVSSALWLPVSNIVVVDSGNALFPYKLINQDDSEIVEAQLIHN